MFLVAFGWFVGRSVGSSVIVSTFVNFRQIFAVAQILKIRNDEGLKALIKDEQSKIKREKKYEFKTQRLFLKPEPNYKAKDYIEFTPETERTLIYEPLFTKDHSDKELKTLVEQKLDLIVCNNSVLTERVIRDMADVAKKSTSSNTREAMIHCIRQSRQLTSSD